MDPRSSTMFFVIGNHCLMAYASYLNLNDHMKQTEHCHVSNSLPAAVNVSMSAVDGQCLSVNIGSLSGLLLSNRMEVSNK